MADNLPNSNDIASILAAAQNPTATNIALDRGNDIANNQVLVDRAQMDPFTFAQKYGPEVVNSLNNVDLNRASTQNLQDSQGQTLGDAISNIGIGVINSAGGAVTLGSRLFGRDAAQSVGRTVANDIAYFQGQQSQEQKNSRFLAGTTEQLDKQDNTAQYQKDLADNGRFSAELNSVGRGAVDAAARLIENPTSAAELTEQGIGSVLAAAPTGGAISVMQKVGKDVLKTAVEGSVAKTALSEIGSLEGTGLVPRVVQTAEGNIPLSVGTMEAGGAYAQVSQQVLSTPFDDLSNKSPEYRNYIQQGYSPEEARSRVADAAGLEAAAIQGPLAAATGKLVEGFEAHPLHGTGLVPALQNVGKETLEEGLQNASGTLSQNLAIQQHADTTQRLTDDLGSQVVQGALAGGLSAGAIEGPAVLSHAAASLAGAPKAVYDKGKSIIANMQSAAPNSVDTVSAAVNDANTQTNDVVTGLSSLAPKDDLQAQDYIGKVQNALTLSNQDLLNIPRGNLESMVQTLGAKPDLVEAMAFMATEARDEQNSPEDRASAALFVAQKLKDNADLFNNDLPAFLQNVSHDDENYQKFETYGKIAQSIGSIPDVKEALFTLEKPDLIPANSNPVTVANQVAGQAQFAPQAVNPDLAEKVLYQADQGNAQLTEVQKNQIRSSIAVTRAGQTYDQMTNTKPEGKAFVSDIVSRQIATEGGKASHQLSMVQHVQGINEAISAGNDLLAQQRAQALEMFAQGQSNKVGALNRSIEHGKGAKVKYQSAGPNNEWIPEARQFTAAVHLGNENSENFARTVYAEASALAQLSNSIKEQYPQLNMKQVDVPKLNLRAPSEQLTEAQQTPKAEPTEESTPQKETTTSEAPEALSSEPKATTETGENTKSIRNEIEQPSERTSGDKQPVSESEAPVQKETVETAYPRLMSNEGTGANQFHAAYRLPDKPKSRLAKLISPINDLRKLLDTPKLMVEFMDGKDVNYNISGANLDALDEILSLGSNVMRAMNERMTLPAAKKILAAFTAGKPANRWKEGRMLNIMERKGNGFIYNKQLVQSAILAGINQSLNGDRLKPNLEASDVADIMGISPDRVTPAMVADFNRGQTQSDFIRNLASNIIDYWGITTNNKASLSQTQGIAEAVAIEVIHGLAKADLLSTGSFEYHDGDTHFTQNRVYFDQRPQALIDEIGKLGAASKLLDDMILTEKSKTLGISYGSPSGNIPVEQLRSPGVKNTPKQREALAHEGSTPYLLNEPMHRLMSNLGFEFFLNYMGGQIYQEGDLNVNHERSLEGKNRTLEYSYQNVMNQVEELRSHAEKAEKPITEYPAYYDFNMSKVGRMQMQGNNNPQSDKLAREIFMPTKVTLDLNDPKQEAQFWMTVAQGVGVKTEKVTRANAIQQAQDKTLGDAKVRPIIDTIAAFLKGGELPDGFGQTIIDAMPVGSTMHGLHGLLSVAQYLNAFKDGSDSKFEHYNYLEADGKTNGPIMTTALFASRITPDIIKVLRKGGIFLGEENRSLNDHILNRDPEDLYQATTTATGKAQDDFTQSISDNPKALDKLAALSRVMAAIDANITLGEDDENGVPTLKLDRGVTKNPLTISIYGSGIDGIAGKLASSLLDGIYKHMSDLTKNGGTLDGKTYDGFVGDLKELISEEVRLTKEKEIKFSPAKGSDKGGKSNSPQDFTFSPSQFNAFKSHVRVFFVNQMHQGIHDQILQHVEPSTSALQLATNLQSIFLTGAYQQAIVDKLLALKSQEGYHEGDFLSQSDLDQIMKDLKPLSPIVNTGTQNFFIAGNQKADIMDTVTVNGTKIAMPDTFARGIDGNGQSPAFVYGPDVAGVKGVPSLVIGTGDGMIMQDAATVRNAPKGTLKVFDGINLPATDIDESSRIVNQSVFKAMTANPMQAVAGSFNTFLANDPVDLLLGSNAIQEVKDFVILEATKALTGSGNPKELLSEDEIRQGLIKANNDLNNLSQEIEARNEVLKSMTISVDQMASAESPFTQTGTLATSLSEQEMSDIINNKQDEVLQEIREGKKNAPAVERNNSALLDSLEDTTTPDENGASIATIPSLLVWLQNRAKEVLNSDQREFFGTILTSLKGQDYRVLFGTTDQLNAYEALNYPEYFTNTDYLGKIIPEIRHAFIANASAETLLHEMIHAATIDKVVGYYNNPSALSAEDREAVKRIEGLMNEWLVQSTEADSEALNTARSMATNQIAGYIQTGQPALALNEFMAWVLSNQELIKATKKVAVKNPVFRIIGEAISAIKALIWGKRGPSVDSDIFSNLRFNTRVLLKTPTPTELLRADMRKTAVYQSDVYGADSRLTMIRNMFVSKMAQYITDPLEMNQPGRQLDQSIAATQTLEKLHGSVAAVFGMNMQQFSTFQAIHTAMALNTRLNTNALNRVQDIYDHVINKIAVENLMKNPTVDHPADRELAQQKFNIITGNGAITDALGRSDRLSTFVSLAAVDNGLRSYLAQLDVPKSLKSENDTLDNILDNIGSVGIDTLNTALAGDRTAKNVQQAVDMLSLVMAQSTGENALFYEKYTAGFMDRADAIVKDNIEKLSDRLHNKASNIRANSNNKAIRIGAGVLSLAAAVVNNRTAEQVAKGVISGINNMPALPQVAHDFVVEMIGRTNENKSVIDQVSEGRAAIQQTRQQFVEQVPFLLGSKFKTPLTDEQKTHLFYGLGKTDAAALERDHGIDGTLALLSDKSKRSALLKDLQDQLKKIDSKRFVNWNRKSSQLAKYMIDGTYGVNLLRNAIAITHLFGEVGFNPELNEDAHKIIDKMTTLHAIEYLSEGTKEEISRLVKDEPEGMKYLQSYLVGTRKDEQTHISTDNAAINHYKGYIPSTNQEGVTLRVENDENAVQMQQLGYVNMGQYYGSSADRARKEKSYWFSPVSARATYNQGAMQMVHQTVSGIQPGNGYTVENIAGRITDPTQIANAKNLIRNQRQTQEPLLPVYDPQGNILAYERPLAPAMISLLNKNTDIMHMTGVWNGRQVEEQLAMAFNNQLVDNLSDIWNAGRKEKDQFVDISKSNDPIHKDTWKIIPQDVKNYINEKFGRDGFMIRKDMINNAIGYRQASIGDAWTGNSRINEETQKTVRNIAMGIFGGDKAFKTLVQGERMLQHLVGEAKNLIVVKSLIVPLANAVANVYQLMIRGIPLSIIGKSFAGKTAEINSYVERRKEQIKLQADLRAAEGSKDIVAQRKLSNRIASIEDSFKRMSIYPLIKAGEFSMVADGGLDNDDLRISNFIDKITGYIPEKLQTPYRYAMITKDTPIYKFLAYSVQYGDFVAKATMYDFLVNRKGMSAEDAMAAITEEFVNYNLLAGRTRNYSDSVGLTWFLNFKIRSTKTAMSLIRNNPARALFSAFAAPALPVVGHVGTPLDDNLLTSALHGNITNNIGFGPAFRAPSLNPWVNILK